MAKSQNPDGVFQRAAATRWHYRQEPGLSLVALLTGCRAARRSLRDGKEERLARSHRRPRPWPCCRGSGCCWSTAFRLGLPPAHASGQGWWGGQRAAGARLALSLSLAGARQPARARKYGPRWRQQEGHSGGGRHAPAERARPAPARLVIVDRRSHRLGGAGSRRSCGLLHTSAQADWLSSSATLHRQQPCPLLKFSRGVCK